MNSLTSKLSDIDDKLPHPNKFNDPLIFKLLGSFFNLLQSFKIKLPSHQPYYVSI